MVEGVLTPFSYNLRRLRKQAKMKQKDLAHAVGVTAMTISNYENGNTVPDSKLLGLLAKTLNVTPHALLGLKINELEGIEILNKIEELKDDSVALRRYLMENINRLNNDQLLKWFKILIYIEVTLWT